MKCFENFGTCSKVALGQENSKYYSNFHKYQEFNILDFAILTKKDAVQKVLSSKGFFTSFSQTVKRYNLLLLIISFISEQNIMKKINKISLNSGFVRNFKNFGHAATLFS